MRRAVRPGGVILVEGFGPRQSDYCAGGPKLLAARTAEEILRKSFGDLPECDARR